MKLETMKILKVLFIEDDEIQQNELADYLKRRVGKIYFASNGEEGLEKYRLCNPNLILCDVRMPKMDGITMLAKLRKIDSSIPVLMLSALSDKDIILSAVDLNITNYLVKPVDLAKLESIMKQIALEIRTTTFNNSPKGEQLDSLKRDIIKFIKSETGKGPDEVKIKVENGNIVISIFGSMTVFEKGLMRNERNVSMINYLRTQFFVEREIELCRIICEEIGVSTQISKFHSDCLNDEVILNFMLETSNGFE